MGLMRKLVQASGSDWRVESSGTWAINGEPAAINTQKVLEARGIDIRSYRSRLITRELMRQFNLILTMERGHKEALSIEFPDLAGRVHLLSEMVGDVYDINDPIGGPLVDFQDTAKEIDQIFSDGFEKIEALSEDPCSNS